MTRCRCVAVVVGGGGGGGGGGGDDDVAVVVVVVAVVVAMLLLLFLLFLFDFCDKPSQPSNTIQSTNKPCFQPQLASAQEKKT